MSSRLTVSFLVYVYKEKKKTTRKKNCQPAHALAHAHAARPPGPSPTPTPPACPCPFPHPSSFYKPRNVSKQCRATSRGLRDSYIPSGRARQFRTLWSSSLQRCIRFGMSGSAPACAARRARCSRAVVRAVCGRPSSF
jgi:hypothetical protein